LPGSAHALAAPSSRQVRNSKEGKDMDICSLAKMKMYCLLCIARDARVVQAESPFSGLLTAGTCKFMTWSVGKGQAFVAETSVACGGGDDNQMMQRTILVIACAVLPSCNAILLCSCSDGYGKWTECPPVANANDFDFDQGCLF
jgi:hypothetical protein